MKRSRDEVMIHNRFCSYDLEGKVQLVSYPSPPPPVPNSSASVVTAGPIFHLEPFVQHQKRLNQPEDVDVIHLKCNLSSSRPGLKVSVWLLGGETSGILKDQVDLPSITTRTDSGHMTMILSL